MTILNDYVLHNLPFGAGMAITLLAGLVVVFSIWGIVAIFDEGKTLRGTLLLLTCIVCIFSAYMISDTWIYEEHYLEVTLDEDVSFTEIAHRYDLVERRGDIWKLREKTKEE